MSTMEQQYLNQVATKIMTITEENVKSPNMPISTFATECEAIRETYLKDSLHFEKRRIDTAVLAGELDIAVGSLREAEMLWHEEATGQKEATKQWKGYKNEAYDLREEAESSLDFILDEEGDSRDQLNAIIEGTGHSDMILDLGKLHRLSQKHATELEEIAFDSMMIARLEELYTALTDVYGRVSSDKVDDNQARITRDRAFTYCRALQNKIKKAAKLVLRKEPELLSRYRSEQYRKQYLNKN